MCPSAQLLCNPPEQCQSGLYLPRTTGHGAATATVCKVQNISPWPPVCRSTCRQLQPTPHALLPHPCPLLCSLEDPGQSPAEVSLGSPGTEGGVSALPPPLVTSLPAGIMMSPVQHSLFLLGYLQAPGWGHSPGACDSSCPRPRKGDKHGNNPQGGGEGSLRVAGSPFPGKAKAVTKQGD